MTERCLSEQGMDAMVWIGGRDGGGWRRVEGDTGAVAVWLRFRVMCENVKIDPSIIEEGRMQYVGEGKERTVAAV